MIYEKRCDNDRNKMINLKCMWEIVVCVNTKAIIIAARIPASVFETGA